MDTVTSKEPTPETTRPLPLILDLLPEDALNALPDEDALDEDALDNDPDAEDEDDDWIDGDDDDEEWEDEDEWDEEEDDLSGEEEEETEVGWDDGEDDDWDDEPLLETRFRGVTLGLDEERPRAPRPSRGSPHDRRGSRPRDRGARRVEPDSGGEDDDVPD